MNRNAFVFTSLKTFNLYNYFLNFYVHCIYWNFKKEKEPKAIHGKKMMWICVRFHPEMCLVCTFLGLNVDWQEWGVWFALYF